MTTMAATKPHTKSWEIPRDFTTKLLMFVITLLLSTITWIAVKTMNKVDTVSEDVQTIKEMLATYKEKVDQLEKKEDKK